MALNPFLYYLSNSRGLLHRLESSVMTLLDYHESKLDIETIADILSSFFHVFKHDSLHLVKVAF